MAIFGFSQGGSLCGRPHHLRAVCVTCILNVIYLSGELHVYPTSYYKFLLKQHNLGQGQGYSTLRTVLDQSASALLPLVPSQIGRPCDLKTCPAFSVVSCFSGYNLGALGSNEEP